MRTAPAVRTTSWPGTFGAILLSAAIWLVAGASFGFAATYVYAWHGSVLWVYFGVVVGAIGTLVSAVGWALAPFRRQSSFAQSFMVALAVCSVVGGLAFGGLHIGLGDLSSSFVLAISVGVFFVALSTSRAVNATFALRYA